MRHIKKSKTNKNSIRYFLPYKNYNVELSKKKHSITVYGNIIVYGTASTLPIAKKIAHNIMWHWNKPKAKVMVQGQRFSVRFELKPFYIADFHQDYFTNNKDQKNIFIRIEETIKTNISVMDNVGSNTGFFMKSNVAYDGASTEAHEYGHAIGLWPNSPDGHPQDLDQRGKGRPGIMYPRGTWVDPQYQYWSHVQAGEQGGTVAPDHRRVRQLDIDMLGIADRKWNKGKLRLGKLTNIKHGRDVPYALA